MSHFTRKILSHGVVSLFLVNQNIRPDVCLWAMIDLCWWNDTYVELFSTKYQALTPLLFHLVANLLCFLALLDLPVVRGLGSTLSIAIVLISKHSCII